MASVFNFEVTNEDLSVRFSCPNHERRIAETIRNLFIDTDEQDSAAKLLCRYTSEAQNVKFSFDGSIQEGMTFAMRLFSLRTQNIRLLCVVKART